jgi:hypothetical protein
LHPTPDSNGSSDWEDCNKKIPVSTPKAVEGGEEDDVKELHPSGSLALFLLEDSYVKPSAPVSNTSTLKEASVVC